MRFQSFFVAAQRLVELAEVSPVIIGVFTLTVSMVRD
jgi:hypothetical protein